MNSPVSNSEPERICAISYSTISMLNSLDTKLKQRCARCAIECQDLTGSDEERSEKRRKLNQDCRDVEKWYERNLQRSLHINKDEAKKLLATHGGPIKFGLYTRKDAADAETKRVLHLALPALPEGVGMTVTTAKATAEAMAAAAAESSKRSADVISTLSSTASSSSGGASSGKMRPKHDERKHPPPADMHVDPTRASLLTFIKHETDDEAEDASTSSHEELRETKRHKKDAASVQKVPPKRAPVKVDDDAYGKETDDEKEESQEDNFFYDPEAPLAEMMLYLDIDDTPSAARTCKHWRDVLSTVENELWLGLIRKHHPSVEIITALLPDHVGEEKSVASGDIPPPSRSWKKQLKRHRLIEAWDPCESLSSKPLDSYFFEVQYTFYTKNTDEVKSQVSIVIESATLTDDSGKSVINLCFKRDRIAEHLSDKNKLHHNTYVRVLIRIFERSTGRQSRLFFTRFSPQAPTQRWTSQKSRFCRHTTHKRSGNC